MLGRLEIENNALHQKKIRPLEVLCQTLNAINQIQINAIPSALVIEYKQFAQAVRQLDSVAKIDGKMTSYNYDDVDREERDRLHVKLTQVREKFNIDLLEYEHKLAAMEAEIRKIHLDIMEFNRANSILEEKKLVKEQELYQQLSAENEEKKNIIDKQNCCYKYILCCFTSTAVNKTQQSITKLKDQQQKLLLSDPSASNTITIASLTLKREQLYLKQKELIANPPQLNDEALAIQLGQAIARIEEGETKYYTEVTKRIMFHLVRVDALYNSLVKKMADFPILPLNPSVKKLFVNSVKKITELINQFWCATPEVHETSYFKEIFGKLRSTERAEILLADNITPELVNKIVFDDGLLIPLP